MQHTGLDIKGTVLGHTRLKGVDGRSGQIIFCGYDVGELAAHASWEEVVYLLWHDDLPTDAQLATLREHIAPQRCLDGDEMEFIRSLPREGHGMDALRTVVSALAEVHTPSIMQPATVFEDGLRLTAKLATIVTTLVRLRRGEEPVPPNPNLSHAANFLWMLDGKQPDPAAVQALNTYMVTMAENGLNASTFAACVVASTTNDLYSAITAAIAALKGLSHGGASEQTMHSFLSIGSPDQASDYLDDIIRRDEALMRISAVEGEDPRVQLVRAQAEALATRAGADDRSYAVAERVAELMPQKSFFRDHRLHPSVDFYSASLLYQLGFSLDYFTAVYACACIPGWVAHIHEQVTSGAPVRPDMQYAGRAQRSFVPLEKRV